MDHLDNARVAKVQRRGVDAAALRPNNLAAEDSRERRWHHNADKGKRLSYS